MEVLEWATVWYASAASLTVVVIVVTAYYAVKQFIVMAHDSDLGFLKNIMEAWDSERMQQARRAVEEATRTHQNTPTPPEETLKQSIEALEGGAKEKFYTLLQIPNFFEWQGIILQRYERFQEIYLESFADAVVHYFELYSPWIAQKRPHNPQLYKNFEKLYHLAHHWLCQH